MSISPESIDGDITTDHHDQQVDRLLPSSSGLRTKEELRQTKEKLKNMEELVDKTFEQMEESFEKLKLENKVLRAELEHQKVLNALQMQQQTIDALTEKLKVSIDQLSLKHQEELEKLSNAHKNQMEEMKTQREMDVAKLEEQKLSSANKFAQIEQKNDKLEKKQNEQQLHIVNLQTTLREIGLTPQNRWNSAACNASLALIGPDQLSAQHNGEGWSSVLAEEPIPNEYFGIYYFEVKILAKTTGNISIGLATGQMPLGKGYVGVHDGTYAYTSNGLLWGHAVEGCGHTSNGRPYIGGKPPVFVGDVIGCGVNLQNGQIIYTMNGRRLATANLFVDFAVDLFPCVSLDQPGTKIEANFGPNFQWNIADEI